MFLTDPGQEVQRTLLFGFQGYIRPEFKTSLA